MNLEMKKMQGLLVLSLMALLGCGTPVDRTKSAAPAKVVAPSAPQAWEKTAAVELTNWLYQVTAQGRVRVDGTDGIVFHVGDTDFAKEKGLGSSAFKDEEWCVKSFGKDVVLNGGGTRGALYAVYHFLEDDCGVRWWNDNDFDVSAVETLDLPILDRRGRPFFRYRDIYRDYGRVPEPLTPVRLRLNGNGPGHIPLKLGGGIEYGPPYLTHTFGRYLPFEKYGKDHPEWYAWHKKTGKRDGGMTTGQFCLSNKELLKVMTEKVKESVKKGEEKSAKLGLAKPKIYSLVMNDSKYPCECDDCLAEVAQRGYSGQMVRFANAIAAEVGKDHPDIFFKTSAYLYTEEPPKDDTRAADNILLDVATTTDNLAGPIDDPGCDFVRRMLDGWTAHAKHLFIWTYAVTYWKSTIGWPFPSEYHLPGKMRFFADKGAIVYFAEQEHSQTADMYELKLYLQRKLAEDPYADAEALRADFMRRYYGAAGAEVAAARELLEANRKAAKAKVQWFPRPHEFVWLTDETLAGMRAHFDAAERLVADDEKRLNRVKVARTSVDRVYETRGRFRACAGRYSLSDFSMHDVKNMPVDTNGVLRLTLNDPKFSRENLFKAGVSNMKSGVTLRPEGPETEGEWTWYSAEVRNIPNGYFYFCNWLAQLEMGLPELVGKSFRLRLRARLTGPAYYPGSTRTNLAEIDAFETLDLKGDEGR